MKKPICVNTNSEGMGTPENPYRKPTPYFETGFTEVDEGNLEAFNENTIKYINLVSDFEAQHPPFPTYSQNNVLIRGERVEVEPDPIWQYKMPNETEWTSDLNHDAHKREFQVWYDEMKCIADFETRRIYRQVAIKEEKRTEEYYCQTCSNPHELCTCLSSAQSVKEGDLSIYADTVGKEVNHTPHASKEVKSAEEILNSFDKWAKAPSGDLYTKENVIKAMHAHAAQHQQSEGMGFIQRVYDLCSKRNMPTEGEIQSLEIEAFNLLNPPINPKR